MRSQRCPPAQGLYDPRNEHDACGVGFIAHMKGVKSHQIVRRRAGHAREPHASRRRRRRSADGRRRGHAGADPRPVLPRGNGQAGHRAAAARPLCASAICSCRATQRCALISRTIIREVAHAEGQTLIGFRDVPVDNSLAVEGAATSPPRSRSTGRCSSAAAPAIASDDDFERRLYILRKVISGRIHDETNGRRQRLLYRVDVGADHRLQGHVPRLPGRRLLQGPAPIRASRRALVLVHQRFSTNTFPSWKLAHPYRMVAHNGEINTLRGNVNWMAARQASVEFGAVRQRHLEAVADLLRRPVRHRLLRQCARVPVPGRLFASPCHDDADPGSLGRQQADGCRPQGLLRVPRRADGAVGRPGGGRLHRRPPDRRDARPQRPAAGALHRHRRRPRHHGLGSRRAAGAGRKDRQEVAAAARQDAADRPREGPHHLGRGDQGGDRHPASLQANGSPTRSSSSKS